MVADFCQANPSFPPVSGLAHNYLVRIVLLFCTRNNVRIFLYAYEIVHVNNPFVKYKIVWYAHKIVCYAHKSYGEKATFAWQK